MAIPGDSSDTANRSGNNRALDPVWAPVAEAAAGSAASGREWLLAIVALAGFVLTINNSWEPSPDAALYLSLGESLALGEGYVFNGEPHSFVPPGYPALIAAAAWIGGPSFLTYRILSALCGMIAALFGYLLVRRLCGRDAAFLVGGVFALNHVLLHNSTVTLSDVPFAAAALFGLYISVTVVSRGANLPKLGAAGVLLGILPLIRINGLGVPPAVGVYVWSKTRNGIPGKIIRTGLFLFFAAIPFIVWQAWKQTIPMAEAEGDYFVQAFGRQAVELAAVIGTAVWEYFPETTYALIGVSIKTGFLELIPPAFVLVGLIEAVRRGERLLAPIAVVQFAGLLLSSAGSRYLIFLLPALYLFLALGIVTVVRFFSRTRNGAVPGKRILLACFILMAIFNAGHNVKTVVSARTALESGGPETPRRKALFDAARWLRTNAPDAKVLTTRPRIVHYLAGNRTITVMRSGVPMDRIWVREPHELRALVLKTNPDYVLTDAKQPELFANLKDVVHDLGGRYEEVPEVGRPRYRLYRIVKPPAKRESGSRVSPAYLKRSAKTGQAFMASRSSKSAAVHSFSSADASSTSLDRVSLPKSDSLSCFKISCRLR